MNFISETNKAIHKEELVRMKHRRAIFEKSYGGDFKTLRDIRRSRIPAYERDEISRLVTDITLHDIYFSSFGAVGCASERVRKRFGNEASFLYELYECARAADGGFLLVFSDGNGKIDYFAGRDHERWTSRGIPCLAIDIEEHAYFYDYFFERDSYIKSALSELNLSKI